MHTTPKYEVLLLGWTDTPNRNSGLGMAFHDLKEVLKSRIQAHIICADDSEVPQYQENTSLSLPETEGPSRIGEKQKPSPYHPYGDDKTAGSFTSEPSEAIRSQAFAYARHINKAAAHVSFDLIHAHDWFNFLPALQLQQASGKPLILHIHSLDYDHSGPKEKGWRYQLEKEAMTRADHLISVSQYTARVIAREYGIPMEKISIVPNAIRPVKPVRRKPSFPEKLVIFVGRMASEKGPHHFLDLAENLIKRGEKVRFALAGDGPLMHELTERVAMARLSDRIHFMGFLEQKALHKLMSMADLFVMPSQSEPFGLAALEAAAFGVPCILSPHCGVAEILKNAPIIDPGRADLLADLATGLLHHEPRAQRLANELQAAAMATNWEATGERILEIYRGLDKENLP